MTHKEIITKLIIANKDDSLMLEFIKDTLDACGKYIDIINQQDTLTTVYKHTLSREDLLSKVQLLDQHRRMVHNIIITGIKRINFMCKENNLPPFYSGNENDRVAIGNFAMVIVAASFNSRRQ